MTAPPVYLGIDVQVRRPCAWAALDGAGRLLDSGWLRTPDEARAVLERLGCGPGRCQVGIDAPRRPRPAPRAWHWHGASRAWRPRAAGQSGRGRHCEVVVKALGLGNPQWTPVAAEAPEWMTLGFRLFTALAARAEVHEVFPSAAYRMLRGRRDVAVTLDFSAFAAGPKDLLDACVAAATVREYAAGRGCAVGGGDGLGAIVLPGPLPAGAPPALLDYPEEDTG